MRMYLSECCDALPYTETYENMGKCSRCKEDSMFYEETLIGGSMYVENVDDLSFLDEE
jgi:hypothetical protein|tara:strand:+ start:375 stop:548 length:174 start_codon:yes stop_codon:yes gene_type:complete